MVEPSARYEEVKVPLLEPVGELREVTGVLGIPEWWPTGSRVAVVLGHGSSGGLSDPLIEHLQHELTERKFMTLRFNFPFWENHKAGKRSTPDPLPVLERTFRASIATLGRDPIAAPAYLFLGGKGVPGVDVGPQVLAELGAHSIALEEGPRHPAVLQRHGFSRPNRAQVHTHVPIVHEYPDVIDELGHQPHTAG